MILVIKHKQKSQLLKSANLLCIQCDDLIFRSCCLQKMRQFQKTLEDLCSRVASAETTTTTWNQPKDVLDANENMQHLQRLRDKMMTAGALLDDCNEQQSFFTANHVLVPNQSLAKLEDLNAR